MTTASTSSRPVRRLARSRTAGRTTIAKVGQTNAKWLVIDGAGKTLGRLAVEVATRLMGKHKPIYTPNVDTGDYVVVLNTSKIKVSGRKADQRQYDYYTYYPGGHGVASLKDLQARRPNKVFELAVRRMLPKNRLGEQMLTKLKCYADDKHPHAAQKPEKLEL
ncbi:MAG TPA: 50S ribosomal protein L13 [Phycisphaerae bacterium]|nr:50S ribosomal protein L13 [Phycisphaerae bacterium]